MIVVQRNLPGHQHITFHRERHPGLAVCLETATFHFCGLAGTGAVVDALKPNIAINQWIASILQLV